MNDQDRADLRAYLDGQAAELSAAITAGNTDRAEAIISHVEAEFSAEFAESIIPNLMTRQFEMLAGRAGQGDPEALRQLRRGLALIAGVPDTEAEAPAPALIQYRNLSGALIAVHEGRPAAERPGVRYWAECTGCLLTLGSPIDLDALRSARDWAVKHRANCHALPQALPYLPEPDYPDFRALAHEYARKAADAIDGRGLTQVADKNRALAAETYAGLAGVYAMLAPGA